MKINVPHIAKLANLSLTDTETKKFETQLSAVLAYIQKLNEVDVTGITPTNQVTGLENVTREDVTAPSLTQEKSLSNVASQYKGFFQVKGILDNE